MAKRIFLIVLDSFGIGAEPDAPAFGDAGTNTLGAIAGHPNFKWDQLARLGMFNLDGVTCGTKLDAPVGCYARLREASAGKDTTIGHWEIAGLLSPEPLPTFPNGFPKEVLDEFTARTGYQVLCNKPYSGTEVIKDYGEEHMKTGALIVYTSADSVFQIAANEAIVPVEKLYEICAEARRMLVGKYVPLSGIVPPTSPAPRAAMISAWCRPQIPCWMFCSRLVNPPSALARSTIFSLARV